ncbi:hypothetical protein [Lysinibacillus sp. NPDC096212]|uniref:hypothetical protein n=1 Tax=Lysinibacillus sp. NPDC096212 TaxID=3364135 RepID=UPI0037F886A1
MLTEIKVKSTKEPNYKMYYQIEEHCIYYNVDIIKNSASDFNLDFEDYFKIIFCHELGHALDKNLQKNHQLVNGLLQRIKENPISRLNKQYLNDIKNINIKNEQKAWENASGLIDASLKSSFDKVKEDSLSRVKEIAKLEMENMRLKILNAIQGN